MLSPHEFAALLFVRHAPDQLSMMPTQLETLLELQLVEHDELAPGREHWRLTEAGHHAVRMIEH